MSHPAYHQLIPKDLAGNLRWRLVVSRRIASDASFAKAIRRMCREDILFWINGFVWTFDPRRKPRTKIPMITYDYQDRAILDIARAIDEGHDLLIEKSRDMGASWINILVFVWFWMFRTLQSFLMISRVEGYVDDPGNPKSLFWKVDFTIKHMPMRLRPRVNRTKLHIENLDTGSVIDGEATTGRAARGDRRTAILLDEFAAVDQGHKVLSATRDATNCRLFNSTHEGTGTAYYDVSRTGIRKIRMHWAAHPLKAKGLYTRRAHLGYMAIDEEYWRVRPGWRDEMRELDDKIRGRGVPLEDGKLRSPWYAEQCERAAHAVEIAQELDIDVMGSAYQFFASATIEDYITRHCRKPMHIGNIEFDPETLEFIKWREDSRGPLRLWLHLDGAGRPTASGIQIGCDVSAGTGASNSALSGVSRVSLEKVLEYANPHIRPEAFGRYVVAVANWLGGPKVIWEQNGPGRQFGDALIEAGYRHVYYRTDEEKVNKLMSDKPGWAPTKDNKLALLGEYRRALELETLINPSELSLRDALEYVYLPTGTIEHSKSQNSYDPTGARSNHGDRVIADALAWKIARDRPKERPCVTPKVPTGCFFWRRNQAAHTKRRQTAWT